MSLADVWFCLIAILWTGFFVLEGFDFGVGALHGVLARSDDDRRVAINTIGPFWDGNEVWLVVGAAGIFAAFPGWYATWLSASYLLVLVLLVALIIRGVSFEFRGKVDTDRWRRTWSGTLMTGSLLAPFGLGLVLGNLVAGLPVNADQEFTGTFWDLFTGYGVWTAVTLELLCLVHGSTFLALRTTGALADRARALGQRLAWAAMVAVVVLALWTIDIVDVGPAGYALLTVLPVAVFVALLSLRRERDGRAFTATALAIGGTVVSLFVSLYPDVLVSSTSASYNLTVANTASGAYALKVMTIIVAVILPVVLLYQGYSYVVFRHRISAPVDDSRRDGSAPRTAAPHPSR
jgi:cytochrome d ubiquinol oxidase subunit II